MNSSPEFLAGFLVLLGALGLLAGLAMLRFPAAVRDGLLAFPRSKGPGRLLSVLCVGWVYWVVSHAALGMFDGVKPFLPVAALVLAGMVIYFMDELLSPRALGGLLLLVANPVLNGVRWVDSPWSIVASLIAYVWIVLGCALMLHPWLFRKLTQRVTASSGALRRAGWLKLLVSAGLLAAGLWQFR